MSSETFNQILENIKELVQLKPGLLENALTTLVVIFALWLIRLVVLRLIRSRVTEPNARYRWRKTTLYVAVLLALIGILRVWFQGFDSITTYLGLVSAGIAIALRDPLTNLAGWLFILWRRPFSVGDRIEIGGHAGDVIDQRIFQLTLMEIGNWVDADQPTGRIIHIPNAKVFSEMQANYSEGWFQYIWHEIQVLVTFESDWKKAKTILEKIARDHGEGLTEFAKQRVREASRRFMIFDIDLNPLVFTTVKDSGVMLTIRFLCLPRERRATDQAIWEDILTAFHENDDIDFAYPTRRLYNNSLEGKPGAGGPSRQSGSDSLSDTD